MKRIVAATLFALACCGSAAAQERLVVSLSSSRVAITSNFAGEDLVLFGTVEQEPAPPRSGSYDLVVTVAGPSRTLRTRRKTRVLGIWVNVDSREFVSVPAYLAVLSSEPVADIASRDILRRLQIGLDNYILRQHIGADFADTVPDDPFRAAFVRLAREQRLYIQNPAAVTLLTPTVFRAAIPLPSDAPTGHYTIDVKLFTGGKMVAQTDTGLDIIKVGFEQYVADAARDHGFLYGLATMLMALLTGWVASVVFRRD
jgi:uncharacterized protein (TIGR02186 family)